VLADPREVPNRREGGDGESGPRIDPADVCIQSRPICDNVRFCFGVFLDSLVLSLDDRRGVSALGPLIDGGCGLDNFVRGRCGETRASTLEVEETTLRDVCLVRNSLRVQVKRWRR
jgi:hypothetical protein